MSLKTVSVAPLTVFLSENDGFLTRNTQLFTKNGVFYKTLGKILVHVDQKTVSVTPLTVFLPKTDFFLTSKCVFGSKCDFKMYSQWMDRCVVGAPALGFYGLGFRL